MFSHTPVVYVNEDVWGAITQPNQKIIAQLHLTQIKRLKMLTLSIKKYYKVFGFKEEQGTLTTIIAFLLVIAALLIGVFFYVITLQNTAIRRIKSDWYKELVFSK